MGEMPQALPFGLERRINRKLPEGAVLLSIAEDVKHERLDSLQAPEGHIIIEGFYPTKWRDSIGFWYAYSIPEHVDNMLTGENIES